MLPVRRRLRDEGQRPALSAGERRRRRSPPLPLRRPQGREGRKRGVVAPLRLEDGKLAKGRHVLQAVVVDRAGDARVTARIPCASAEEVSGRGSQSSPAAPRASAPRSRGRSRAAAASASCSHGATSSCRSSPARSAASRSCATSATARPSSRRRRGVLERHPRIGLLVNNAGIPGRTGFVDGDPERIELLIRINYLGAVWCLRAFLPGLLAAAPVGRRQRRLGLGGRRRPPSGPYAASKHAQLSFSRTVAAELRGERRPRAPRHAGLRRDGRLPAGLAAGADPADRDRA